MTNIFNDPNFLRNNLKDPALAETYIRDSKRKARTTSIVLVSFVLVTIMAVVYGFVLQASAQKAEQFAATQKAQLDLCILESQKQQALAEEARMIGEEANKAMQIQLLECQKRK